MTTLGRPPRDAGPLRGLQLARRGLCGGAAAVHSTAQLGASWSAENENPLVTLAVCSAHSTQTRRRTAPTHARAAPEHHRRCQRRTPERLNVFHSYTVLDLVTTISYSSTGRSTIHSILTGIPVSTMTTWVQACMNGTVITVHPVNVYSTCIPVRTITRLLQL